MRRRHEEVANRQTLHVLAQPGPQEQDLGWSPAQFEDASVLEPCGHAAEDRGRERGENTNGPRRLLPSPRGPNGQGEGRDRYRAEARDPLLQGPSLWYDLRRPRSLVLLGTLPPARHPASPAPRAALRLRARCGPRSHRGSFLGK